MPFIATRSFPAILVLLTCLLYHMPASGHSGCAGAPKHLTKTTLGSLLENHYDVRYLKLDLSMTNLSTALSGHALTRAVVTEPTGMGQYVFELSDDLAIDSMKLNGSPVTPQTLSPNVKSVTLAASLPVGSVFTAQVYYHGAPPSGTGFFTRGVNHKALASGTKITFTLSDPNLSRDWWPCKQSLTDKIDSADLWFTVPNDTKAGSNGLLQQVTPSGANASRYEWKTRYPIDYYLITVAVAPYVDHSTRMHFTGSNDSMLIQHYVYDTATIFQYKPAFDSTGLMVDYLSTLYGRYPFWKEKYGHCTAPLSGGMEHQTMTTLGGFTTPLIAHELGHQWWGDNVTYTSWRDIWLSEGWASYTEQLFVERFHGAAAAQSYRTPVFNRAMLATDGSVYVDDTTSVNRIFDPRLTYDKGAAVAHMLRFEAPDDNTFFAGLQAYQQQYGFKTATTEEFKAVMEQAYGSVLDTFFNQWVYGEGYPTFSAKWNQTGNTVFVQLGQTPSKPASVSVFHTPLEIRLTAATGDTTVRVYSSQAQQFFSFTWGRTMTGMTIDPANHILNRLGIISKDVTLKTGDRGLAQLRIFPNPAADSWQVTGLPAGASLRLYDATGRLVWSRHDAPEQLFIPAAALPAGAYRLGIYRKNREVASRPLQRL